MQLDENFRISLINDIVQVTSYDIFAHLFEYQYVQFVFIYFYGHSQSDIIDNFIQNHTTSRK